MKPRVAVILSGYGVIQRGAESFLEQLLPRLEERFDLHVFSRSGAGPRGVRRPAIPRRATEKIYGATRLGRKLLDTLFLDPLHVEWTSHLLSSLPALIRGRFDLIWHETGLWGGYLLAGLRRFTGSRLVDIAHSSHPGWEIPFARRRPDLYLTFTAELAESVRDQVSGLAVEVIPQGIDCDRFRPGLEPWPLAVPHPRVLVVGALAPEKDPLLALEAIARTGASAVFAGEGPLAERLDQLAASRVGGERYSRLVLPRADMPHLYNAVDVVLLASPFEAGPLAVLEAMACGKPVVTAADPVRRQMLDGGGIAIEQPDADLLARAVDEALLQHWDDRPRERALAFSIDHTAARIAELLDELLGSRR